MDRSIISVVLKVCSINVNINNYKINNHHLNIIIIIINNDKNCNNNIVQ